MPGSGECDCSYEFLNFIVQCVEGQTRRSKKHIDHRKMFVRIFAFIWSAWLESTWQASSSSIEWECAFWCAHAIEFNCKRIHVDQICNLTKRFWINRTRQTLEIESLLALCLSVCGFHKPQRNATFFFILHHLSISLWLNWLWAPRKILLSLCLRVLVEKMIDETAITEN